MELQPTAAAELIRLVQQKYPGWDSVSDPAFVQDEIAYKRDASTKARDLLDKQTLAGLLQSEQYAEIISRFEQVGKATNLLYLSTPSTGDLQLLYQESADPSRLAAALVDLVHGDGDQPARLERFLATSAAQGWPQKWTFSTYFSFLLDPATEVFIKPRAMRWFLKTFAGEPNPLRKPSAQAYAEARTVFNQLREELAPFGAQDMIDVQGMAYVAHKQATAPKSDAFTLAVEKLRVALQDLPQDEELNWVAQSRDEVIGHYQPLFEADHLPELTAEEFYSFLLYKNNRHWTGINRYGSRMTQNMPRLREALAILQDENRPLSERYVTATDMIKGLSKATATPFLLISFPDRYGVWNSKSEAGLRRLDLLPSFTSQDTEGAQYAAINEVLLQLADALEIDLWTLDVLWDVILRKDQPLAPPFNTIFADREQAEWAFDFFKETVELLGGGPNDEDDRFALALPQGKRQIALNFSHWIVLAMSNQGQLLELTLQNGMAAMVPDLKETVRYANSEFARYKVSSDVRNWLPELEGAYEMSLSAIARHWEKSSGSPRRENHYPAVFQALFDAEKRDKLLSEGLTETVARDRPMNAELPPEPVGESTIAKEFKGFTADAFAFLTELVQNNNKEWMHANLDRWEGAVREPMRNLVADLGPYVKRDFDSHLAPDDLETKADAKHTLARISKNWTATPDSQYYPYYWSAFYRHDRTKQTDAQLFINIMPDRIRFGFFVGEQAETIRERFRNRVLNNADAFLALVTEQGLSSDFEFIRTEGTREEMAPIATAEDLEQWVANGDFDVLLPLTPTEAVHLGPALADKVLEAFRRVFPVYLWAVAEDYETAVARYLEDTPPGGDDIDIDPPAPYTRADFFAHTHLPPETLDELQALVDDRKQAIFYGPPGTGKTYVAKELGKLLTGLADPPPDRLEIVQFHPAYSYEDFIEGIRPQAKELNGTHVIDYPIQKGVFRRFCDRARHTGETCVLIIDEINRGNIARIFGELMLLLEYRDEKVTLPYSGDRFAIPGNVIVIGTMNTADRSIALVDFALRRRFHFFEFYADPGLFDRWLAANGTTLPYLSRLYRRLATEAIDDHNFAIGPSYFMRPLDQTQLQRIWQRSIVPYIREYYIDQPSKASQWEWDSDFMIGIRHGENGG